MSITLNIPGSKESVAAHGRNLIAGLSPQSQKTHEEIVHLFAVEGAMVTIKLFIPC